MITTINVSEPSITPTHTAMVTYKYGAAGLSNGLNQIGRIVKVTDASGSEERAYGKLGETVKEVRSIASHTQGNSANSPEVYTTRSGLEKNTAHI